ncbi:hypothetical protein AB0K00_42335 [Dactylosporangium sp. NPDC049525]|uniref:hypothetical protein n=1 Tax=Dactylosporangium sp. NPDC049525 TaxID=3154730 RepID=UPI00343E829E
MVDPVDDAAHQRPAARPRRVVALAVLLLIGGICTLVFAVVADVGPFDGLPPWTYAILSPVYLTLAWAVSGAKKWAWWTLVALHGASGAYLLLSAASMNDSTAGRDLIWPAVYLVVLTSDRTRVWFGITHNSDPMPSETDHHRDGVPKS